MKLVKDGGYLATCSCSHFMDPELFTKTIGEAARTPAAACGRWSTAPSPPTIRCCGGRQSLYLSSISSRWWTRHKANRAARIRGGPAV
mgnify:CR=1 FL=1